MTMKCWWIASFLLLAGCGSQVETITVLPDEYEIAVSPPAGMYGGWLAIAPSGDALTREASARCPTGYKMVHQEVGQGPFVMDFIRWDIHCLPPKGDRAQS